VVTGRTVSTIVVDFFLFGPRATGKSHLVRRPATREGIEFLPWATFLSRLWGGAFDAGR